MKGQFSGAILRFLAALGALYGLLPAMAIAGQAPLIAAAADLKVALTEAAGAFTEKTGQTVKLSFGSSGNFARQITQGAAFELFLSADEKYVRLLAQRGLTEGNGVLYARGRVVLFVPAGSPVKPDPELRGLAAALADGQLRRLAIANPEHAPYGRAAREALMKAGLWERLAGKLVLGENVAQAAQYALTGAVDSALIPYALALAPAFQERGHYVLIAESWHAPLRQRMVLLKGAGATARQFYGFLQQPAARMIFARHGLALALAVSQ